MSRVAASLIIGFAISACASHGRIPDGRYEAQGGQQFVAVQGERVTIRVIAPPISAVDGRRETIEQTYSSYTIDPDARIRLDPMTTGNAIYGTGGYYWYWRDGTIMRREKTTGDAEEEEFVAVPN